MDGRMGRDAHAAALPVFVCERRSRGGSGGRWGGSGGMEGMMRGRVSATSGEQLIPAPNPGALSSSRERRQRGSTAHTWRIKATLQGHGDSTGGPGENPQPHGRNVPGTRTELEIPWRTPWPNSGFNQGLLKAEIAQKSHSSVVMPQCRHSGGPWGALQARAGPQGLPVSPRHQHGPHQ